MKTRERIKYIRAAKSFSERIGVANDVLPGTNFDEFFADCTELWLWHHRNDPDKAAKVRSAFAKRLAQTVKWCADTMDTKDVQDEDGDQTKCYIFLGQRLVEICAQGETQLLSDMADALATWTKHTPQPDKWRSAIATLGATLQRAKGKFTVRDSLPLLKASGVAVNEDTPRMVRRTAGELGYAVKGAVGRPKKK
jgi:hypothetical protein